MKVYATDITGTDDQLDFEVGVEGIDIKTPDDIPTVLQELVEKVMVVSMETTRDWLREAMTKKAEQWVELQALAAVGKAGSPGPIREFLNAVQEEAIIEG